jgi:hypothetical protein
LLSVSKIICAPQPEQGKQIGVSCTAMCGLPCTLLPQFEQNFMFGANELPHSVQNFFSGRGVSHSGQNLSVAFMPCPQALQGSVASAAADAGFEMSAAGGAHLIHSSDSWLG